MTEGKFYITTPIYYPSDNLHIGHAYTTVAADALARYHRLRGQDTRFLTGTDEHGVNIQRRAEASGKTPQQFVDDIVANIKHLWARLEISYDDFIRTTEPRHEVRVQRIFKQLYDQGDIYKSEYEGWYCPRCEAYYTATQVKEWPEGKCPDHGTAPERLREEGYFFRLSRYADRLLKYIDSHPDFIQPAARRNEVISFINQGLEDLCVSRTSFTWGIPVPFDPKHVIYVWVDALSNYATALGYPSGTGIEDDLYRRYWPADVHLIGKEILRFHAIIWPIMLLALGQPLPRQVFGHGWLLLESGKMSKTKGNVVDPLVLIDKYGLDAVRYFLLREVPFGSDGVYSEDALILRTNVDLANDLGNLLSRTTAMLEKFTGGRVPAPGRQDDLDREIPALADTVIDEVAGAMDRLDISDALAAIWRLVNRCNKYIEETAPWALARSAGGRDRLGTVLYNLAESLRLAAVLLVPFLVRTPERIWQQLGLDGDIRRSTWDGDARWGILSAGTAIRRGEPLFPRIETEAAAAKAPDATAANEVSIEEFKRIDFRLAQVVAAERIPGADRLLRLEVDLGGERRQVVAGIARHYRPEDLVGRRVVVVANLKPATLRGIESRGMILAASAGDQLALVTVDGDLPPGTIVK